MKTDNLSQPRAWQLSQASVRGKSHVDNNLPNQDSVFVQVSDSGSVVCAVVSDGAGTAARSGEGSSIAAEFIATRMCQIGVQLPTMPDAIKMVREEFEISINLARQRLDPTGVNLRDFHCTMVAWLSTPVGAYIAQIGDSVALSTSFAAVEEQGVRKVDFFPDGGYHLHEVDRGEYANETHFITEADWKQHLRISELPDGVDAVVLMTDGAMDIAMLRGRVFRGFLSNLLGKLIGTPSSQHRGDTIHAWLDDRQTYGVTGDDKTIFVGIRPQQVSILNVPVFQGLSQSVESPPKPSTQMVKPNSVTPASAVRPQPLANPALGRSAATPMQDVQSIQRVGPAANIRETTMNKRLLGALLLTLMALTLALAGLGYVLFFRTNNDASKPSPQVVGKDNDSTTKHLPSIPAGPLPAETVIPSQPVAEQTEPTAPKVNAAAKMPSGTPDLPTKPSGRWIVVSPPRVVEFNIDGAEVTVFLSEGPDLSIKNIQYKKDELETKPIKEQCKRGTLLKAKGKACSLLVVASTTEGGATFPMILNMEEAAKGGAAIDKVIFFRSNSVARLPGSGKQLPTVSSPTSAPSEE